MHAIGFYHEQERSDRAKFLATQSTESIIAILAKLGREWLDPENPFRNEVLEPIGGPPEAFGRFLRVEIDKYARVIQAAGVPRQ